MSLGSYRNEERQESKAPQEVATVELSVRDTGVDVLVIFSWNICNNDLLRQL